MVKAKNQSEMIRDEVLEERIKHERDQRDSLVKLLDERDRANKEAIRAAFASAEKASEKTDQALKEYKSSSNEWRATLNDIVARMITRVDFEAHQKLIDSKISDLRESRSSNVGRDSGKSAIWAIVVVLIGWGLTIALFLIKR